MSKENVTVAVRVRPVAAHEQAEIGLRCEPSSITLSSGSQFKTFNFTQIIDQNATQQQVFDQTALPLIEDTLKGYHCALLAYGQNNSGKTHTICGGESQQSKGIVPRMVDHLSNRLLAQQTNSRYLLRVGYVLINGQELIDLLGVGKSRMQIIEKGREVQLKGAQLRSIHSLQDIETQFLLGNRKRNVAYAKNYRKKELSTTAFSLYIENLGDQDGKQILRKGRLDIVELAANHIENKFEHALSKSSLYNLSQNSVKNVINSLVYGSSSSVIPYADSKVTKWLRNCWGGECRTTIIFHLHPLSQFYTTSLASLRVATAASMLQNSPSPSINPENSLLLTRLRQLDELRAKQVQFNRQLQLLENQKKKAKGDFPPSNQVEDVSASNQFLNESIVGKQWQQREKLLKEVGSDQMRKIKDIEETLLQLNRHNQHQTAFARQSYTSAMRRLAQLKANNDNQQSVNRKMSQQPANRKISERQRSNRQQINDLQRQFQLQRQQLLGALRDAQEKYRFYEQVSRRTVRKQEIDILRLSSHYDPTSRRYDIPLFAIKNAKATSSLLRKSMSQSISSRRFLMAQASPKSNRFSKTNRSSQNKAIIELKHMQTRPNQQEKDSYFHRSPPKIKKPKTQMMMAENQYQLVRKDVMARRLAVGSRKNEKDSKLDREKGSKLTKQKVNSDSGSVKTISYSPRFRFK